MRFVVAGLIMAAGLVGLVLYAAADDPYYGDGTSHWDHAAGLGTAPIAVGAAVVAAAVTLWMLVRGLASRPASPPLAFAVVVYVVALFFAWTLMGIGH
jgi:hypothetical protein